MAAQESQPKGARKPRLPPYLQPMKRGLTHGHMESLECDADGDDGFVNVGVPDKSECPDEHCRTCTDPDCPIVCSFVKAARDAQAQKPDIGSLCRDEAYERELQKELQRRSQELSEAQNEKIRCQQQVGKLLEINGRLSNEVESLKEKVTMLNEEKNRVVLENRKKLFSAKMLLNVYKTKQKSMSELPLTGQPSVDSVEEQKRRQRLHEAEQELKAVTMRLHDAEQRVENLQFRNRLLASDKERLEKREKQLATDCSDLRTESHMLEVKFRELKNAHRDMEMRFDGMRDRADRAEQQKHHIQVLFDTAKKQTHSLRQQLTETQRRLEVSLLVTEKSDDSSGLVQELTAQLEKEHEMKAKNSQLIIDQAERIERLERELKDAENAFRRRCLDYEEQIKAERQQIRILKELQSQQDQLIAQKLDSRNERNEQVIQDHELARKLQADFDEEDKRRREKVKVQDQDREKAPKKKPDARYGC